MKAVAILQGEVSGEVFFSQESQNISTKVEAIFFDLPKGKHAFHIHEYGDNTNGCTSAGEHYNPFNKSHGGPTDSERHVGDMGNVISYGLPETHFILEDDSITLTGPYSVIGRSVVLHQNEDDLGRGGFDDSLTNGHSGPRLACGVIGLAQK